MNKQSSKILKIIGVSLISIFLTISCSKINDSTFVNLSGSYTSWSGGLYENSIYDSWDFDKTSKTRNYYVKWSYTEKGWTNALKEAKSFEKEWKVENGTFYWKFWDYDMEWVALSFEYINESSFKLDGNLYEKDK